MILTIFSEKKNGKGIEELLKFDNYCYIYDCQIKVNKLYIKKKYINFKFIKTLICDFNEDAIRKTGEARAKLKTLQNVIDLYNFICSIAKNENPDIIIYQEPKLCSWLACKYQTYQKLYTLTQNDDLFSLPKYDLIQTKQDLENIDYYPIILKTFVNTGKERKLDTLVKHFREAKSKLNSFDKKPILALQVINSYIDLLKTYHSLRLIIINDKLVDYYMRPSTSWNVHAKNLNIDKLEKIDIYIKPFIEKNRESIEKFANKIFKICGYGFYAWDVIIYNDKIYICELGLKYFDYFFKNKLAGRYYKPTIDKKFMRNYLEKLLV